jgi:hypothetical protein
VLVPGFKAAVKNGSTASELSAADAHACIMVGSLRPTGYKVAARAPRAPAASSPRMRHPTTNSVPPRSGLSRRGLETTKRAARTERRPTLTAPARTGLQHMWVGAKKRDFKSNKETPKGGSGECVKSVLDSREPHTRTGRGMVLRPRSPPSSPEPSARRYAAFR